MSKQLASLLVDLRVNTAELQTGIARANASLTGFGDTAKKVGGALVGALSVGVVLSFAKSCATAFGHTEQATKKLENALKNFGYQSGEITKKLKAQASAMQDTLGVSDDMVMQMQTVLASFGVAPKEIDKTVRALVDYSTLMGEDAVAATDKLVTAINSGSSKALKSMGIQISSTGDKAKDLALAVEALNKKFGGAAAANADTLAGKVTNLGNQWEDMQKGFGAFIAAIESKLGVLQKLATALSGITRALTGEGLADANTAGSQLMLQQAQKRQLAAVAKVNLYERKDSYGNDLYSALDKANARAELDLATRALQAGTRTTLGGMNGGAGGITAGQTPAAHKQFGVSEKALAEMTEAQIKQYEKQVEANKKAAEHAKKFREEMAKEISEHKKDRAAKMAELRTGTFADKEAENEQREKFRRRNQVVDDALREVSEAIAQRARDLRSRSVDAALGFARQGVGMLGSLGSTALAAAGGAMQGADMGAFAGPKGALVGAMGGAAMGGMMHLLSSSKAFQGTVEMLNGIVGEIAELYGENIAAFRPVISILGKLTSDALKPFQGAVKMVALIVERMAPALMPLVQVFGELSFIVADALFSTKNLAASMYAMETVGRGLFEATKFAGTSLLSVSASIVTFWNALLGKFADSLRTVADVDVAGAKPFAFLNGLASAVGALTLPGLASTLESAAGRLGAMTLPKLTDATEAATDAQEKQATAVERTTRAWLNTPQGYRTQLARFDAMTPEGSGMSGVVGKPSAAGGLINVTIVNENPRVVWAQLKELISRERVYAFGTEEGA